MAELTHHGEIAILRAQIELLRSALDYIDGHGCDEDSTIAQEALEGRWQKPGCCPGH